MPFSKTNTLSQEEWKLVFENIFRPTFEVLGFDCVRSDVKSGAILQNIIMNLHRASIIFADLTDSKPNVLYELGAAHAITKRVIMASQRLEECPSDLKPYGIISYKADPKHEDTMKFQKELSESIARANDNNVLTSPILQFLGQDMYTLEGVITRPIAIMRCIKCGREYEVRVGETTQSDCHVDALEVGGRRRIHPIGIDHEKRGLCGHWECAKFLGLKQYPYS
jgi:hypothetical protein